MVADLTKHLFSLGPEAIEEIAAMLQVTVAPSTTTQSTAQSTFLLLQLTVGSGHFLRKVAVQAKCHIPRRPSSNPRR